MLAHSRHHCKSCQSENVRAFSAEVAIHFPGRQDLNKPTVFVFAKFLVCLNCGLTEFTLPERELGVLATGNPVEGTAISEERRTDGDDLKKNAG
jgi:hypothetical protein